MAHEEDCPPLITQAEAEELELQERVTHNYPKVAKMVDLSHLTTMKCVPGNRWLTEKPEPPDLVA